MSHFRTKKAFFVAVVIFCFGWQQARADNDTPAASSCGASATDPYANSDKILNESFTKPLAELQPDSQDQGSYEAVENCVNNVTTVYNQAVAQSRTTDAQAQSSMCSLQTSIVTAGTPPSSITTQVTQMQNTATAVAGDYNELANELSDLFQDGPNDKGKSICISQCSTVAGQESGQEYSNLIQHMQAQCLVLEGDLKGHAFDGLQSAQSMIASATNTLNSVATESPGEAAGGATSLPAVSSFSPTVSSEPSETVTADQADQADQADPADQTAATSSLTSNSIGTEPAAAPATPKMDSLAALINSDASQANAGPSLLESNSSALVNLANFGGLASTGTLSSAGAASAGAASDSLGSAINASAASIAADTGAEAAGVGATNIGGAAAPQLSQAAMRAWQQYLGLAPDDLISAYTGGLALPLNGALWSGNAAPIQLDIASDLNSALDQLPGYQGTVYRQIDLSPSELSSYQVGDVVTQSGFTSTSTSLDATLLPGMSPKNTQFVIQSQSGSTIPKGLTNYPSESEVLFQSGTQFQVTDVTVNPQTGQNIISMSEATPSATATATDAGAVADVNAAVDSASADAAASAGAAAATAGESGTSIIGTVIAGARVVGSTIGTALNIVLPVGNENLANGDCYVGGVNRCTN